MERARATPTEHDRLAASLVHDAIAFQPAGYANRVSPCWIRRDQLGIWTGTESLGSRHRIRGNELHHAKPIPPIRDKCELRCVNTANLHGSRVVKCTFCIEHLVETRLFGILNVYDREALRPVRDVSICAGKVKSIRAAQGQHSRANGGWPIRIGNIEYF